MERVAFGQRLPIMWAVKPTKLSGNNHMMGLNRKDWSCSGTRGKFVEVAQLRLEECSAGLRVILLQARWVFVCLLVGWGRRVFARISLFVWTHFDVSHVFEENLNSRRSGRLALLLIHSSGNSGRPGGEGSVFLLEENTLQSFNYNCKCLRPPPFPTHTHTRRPNQLCNHADRNVA